MNFNWHILCEGKLVAALTIFADAYESRNHQTETKWERNMHFFFRLASLCRIYC